MKAAILCIGTELVRGEIVNTNASHLADRLAMLGFDVAAVDAVGDEPSRIEAALLRLGSDHDVLVCTGGLGPTTDDVTAASAARLLEVPLERDPRQLARIRDFFSRLGRPVSPSNLKQADLPRGARALPNDRGTAPGFEVWIRRARAFFLPGVPEEMTAMFSTAVEPELERLARTPFHQVRLCTFGLPESVANDRLEGVESTYGVTLGYRVHFPELEIKVLARGDTEQEARLRARQAGDEVRARLGSDAVYGEFPCALPEVVGDLLRQRKLTLALAESCTGGLLAELLTDAAGASDFFLGGAVVYANSAKRDLLQVPELLLERHGAVSAEVARAMAEGARRAYGANFAVAITGIAGPGGGSAEKPVGLVYLGLAADDGSSVRELRLHGSRQRIRRMGAFSALGSIRHVLLHGWTNTD